MEFRGKTYKYVFWDWLWTLAYYQNKSTKLYDWVLPFLKEEGSAKHFVISWASNPESRKLQIEESGLAQYLEDLWTGKDMIRGFASGKDVKRKAYQMYMKKYEMEKSEILIIGDSFEHEIPAAKELGVDWVHISDFVSELGLINTKK